MTGFSRSGSTAQTEVSQDNPNFAEFVKLFNALKETNGRITDYVVGKDYTDEDIAGTSPSETWVSGLMYLPNVGGCTAGNLMVIRRKGTTNGCECLKASTTNLGLLYGIALDARADGEVVKLQIAPKILKLFVGLIPGAMYRVSATAGVLTNAGASTQIGVAVTDTELYFRPTY